MQDKDRQLIEEVIKAAGTAGEHGFWAMAQYQWADGFTDMIGALVAIIIIVTLSIVGLKIKCEDKEAQTVTRVISIILGGLLFAIIFEAGVMSGVTKMIAPEGAAIHSIVPHH